MSERLLAGRRIAVTRAADRSDELLDALGALGATVVLVPLLRVDPIETVGPIPVSDWLLLPSANAARAARRLGVDRAGSAVGVVGPATARAWGGPVAIEAHPATAAALVEALPPGPGRVLVVQGDRARPDLVDGARAKGWTVEALVAYRTVGLLPDATQCDALRDADAVTFASPSAVEACRDAGIRPGGIVVVIGPTTAAAVRAAGWGEPVVASPHTAAGLTAAVAGCFAGDLR